MITQAVLICVLCGQEYHVEAHVIGTYGLCPGCWSRDTLREHDRLESAKRHARSVGHEADLTLAQWLAVIVDYRGLCALCEARPYEALALVDESRGVTPGNCIPCCRSRRVHLMNGFAVALARVKGYLAMPVEEGRAIGTDELNA